MAKYDFSCSCTARDCDCARRIFSSHARKQQKKGVRDEERDKLVAAYRAYASEKSKMNRSRDFGYDFSCGCSHSCLCSEVQLSEYERKILLSEGSKSHKDAELAKLKEAYNYLMENPTESKKSKVNTSNEISINSRKISRVNWNNLLQNGVTEETLRPVVIQDAEQTGSLSNQDQLTALSYVSEAFLNRLELIPHQLEIKHDLFNVANLDVNAAVSRVQETCASITKMRAEAEKAWVRASADDDPRFAEFSKLAYEEAMQQINELTEYARAEVGSLLLLTVKISEVSAAIEQKKNAESLSEACGNIGEYYKTKMSSQLSTDANLRAAALLDGLREALEASTQGMYAAARELPSLAVIAAEAEVVETSVVTVRESAEINKKRSWWGKAS